MHYLQIAVVSLAVTVLFNFGVSVFQPAMFGARADLTRATNPWSFTNTASNGGVTIASSTVTNLQMTATTTALANINVVTSDTATSSVLLGCIQATATSTATPVKLMLYASTSIASSASYGGGTQIGFVTFGYGKCPRI